MENIETKYLAVLEEIETLRRKMSLVEAELELALMLLARYEPKECDEVEHHINHWDEGNVYA